MKKSLILLALFVGALASTAASAGCSISRPSSCFPRPLPTPVPQVPVCAVAWVASNQTDAALTLRDGDKAVNLHSALYARRSYHGGINPRWSGTDRPWSNISSAQVQPGCVLRVMTTDDESGNPDVLPATGAVTDYANGAFPNAGNVGSLYCKCNEIIDTPYSSYSSIAL